MTTTHDPIAQTVSIDVAVPSGSVVVIGPKFLHALAECERSIAHLSVDSPEGARKAADLLSRLTSAGKALEDVRQKVKAPYLAACRAIDDAAKAPAGRIDAGKGQLRKAMAEWDRKVQEAARRMQEEARRAEEARKAADLDISFDDPPTAPAVVEPSKPAGIVWRVSLVLESADVTKLPDELVTKTANGRLIREKYCRGYKEGDPVPEVPGCVFRVAKTAVASGREF